jgi:hypothetical protein
LQQIEQDHEKILGLVQTLVFWEDENGDQVADNRDADGQVAQAEFKLQVVKLLRQCDCRQLSNDGEPPQPNHGSQANKAAALAFLEDTELGFRHLRPFASCPGFQNPYLNIDRA